MLRRIKSFINLFWCIVLKSYREALSIIFPPRHKPIHDDIILVTGGGRGIGRTISVEIAKHQPKHIILWGRTESSLAETAKDIQKLNVNCDYMICDVSSRDQIYSMAKEVEAKFGTVTILINNAGVTQPNSILDATMDDISQTFKTNTLSHFWSIKAFLPGMLEQGRGHLVSINSMLGWAGLNDAVDYCASKFASSGFQEALRDELADLKQDAIHLTTIYPYQVDNSMFAGVSVRFPWLFPLVKEHDLGVKIVDGILRNRSTVLVPKIMYAVACFYSIAPQKVITTIMKFLHVNKTIDQYKDYRKKNGSHR